MLPTGRICLVVGLPLERVDARVAGGCHASATSRVCLTLPGQANGAALSLDALSRRLRSGCTRTRGGRPINDPLLTHCEVVFRGRSLLEDDYGAGASMKEPREGAAATATRGVSPPALAGALPTSSGTVTIRRTAATGEETKKTSEKGVSYTTEGLRGGRAGKGVVDTRH